MRNILKCLLNPESSFALELPLLVLTGRIANVHAIDIAKAVDAYCSEYVIEIPSDSRLIPRVLDKCEDICTCWTINMKRHVLIVNMVCRLSPVQLQHLVYMSKKNMDTCLIIMTSSSRSKGIGLINSQGLVVHCPCDEAIQTSNKKTMSNDALIQSVKKGNLTPREVYWKSRTKNSSSWIERCAKADAFYTRCMLRGNVSIVSTSDYLPSCGIMLSLTCGRILENI